MKYITDTYQITSVNYVLREHASVRAFKILCMFIQLLDRAHGRYIR